VKSGELSQPFSFQVVQDRPAVTGAVAHAKGEESAVTSTLLAS